MPVGVGPAGDPLVLDLKEAAEGGLGPHGLVVGATGSGKSELLRTIVAGLAATHPPDQLAFVLVDFKGGAAFADLAPLPQVAGLITNLHSDLSMVDRAMAALQGELARRQRLLHLAGNQPDLRAYTARRAADPRLEPLPHLLVVVDEFGELLAVRPEFLDTFTAIGRVGRSLGMHLLLASQRLDEGRLRGLDSHLRFRICLRTFSAAESTAVLGVPDAHHLSPAPGTALIKLDASPPVPFTAALISTERPDPAQGRRPGDRPRAAGRRAPGSWPAGPPGLAPAPGPDIALDPLLETAAAGWLRVPVGVVDRPLEQVAGAADPGPVRERRSPGGGRGAEDRQEHAALHDRGRAGRRPTRPTRYRHTPWTSAAGSSIGWASCRTSGPCAVPVRPNGSTIWCASSAPWSSSANGASATWAWTRWPPGTSCAGPRSLRRPRRLRRGLPADRQLGRVRPGAARAGGGGHRARRHRPALRRPPRPGRQPLGRAAPRPPREPRRAPRAAAERSPGVRARPVGGRRPARAAGPRPDPGRPPVPGRPARPGKRRPRTRHARPRRRRRPTVTAAARRWWGRRTSPRTDQAAGPRPSSGGLRGCRWGSRSIGWTRSGSTCSRGRRICSSLGTADAASPACSGSSPRGWPPGTHPRRSPCWSSTCAAACSTWRRCRTWPATPAPRRPSPRRSTTCTASSPNAPQPTRPPPATAVGPDGTLARPAAASGWSAPIRARPRWVVLVDDYDLLPAAAGSPLLPLLDLLGLGRELGFHLVLTRRVAGAARAAFEPVFQRLRELGGPGLVMSGDPGEGPLLGGQRAAPLPPGRGFLVQPRRPPAARPGRLQPSTARRGGPSPTGDAWVGEG